VLNLIVAGFRRTWEGLKQLLGGAESHRRRFQTDL